MSWKTLDELQWSDPAAAEEMQGIHSNSVLFYFMRSPYFDKTSNNNTVYNQAMYNASMFPVLETRERFEDFLRGMSGVEYVVHQAPAEMAPGTGTGVWVIRKQLRRKRSDGQPDDLTVYADYFVVGYNVYQAPTLGDILSSRITSIAVSLSKAFPAMDSMQSWSPARGHVYATPEDEDDDEYDDDEDDDDDDEDDEDDEEEDEDMVDVVNTNNETIRQNAGLEKDAAQPALAEDESALDPRLAEESYAIHIMFGGEYMDEQPVSGRPGEFHLSAASRKNASAAAAAAAAESTTADVAGSGGKQQPQAAAAAKKTSPVSKDGKSGKGTGTGGAGKAKKRKSKGATTAQV